MQDLLAIIYLEQERKLNNVKNEKELRFKIETKKKKKKKKAKTATSKIKTFPTFYTFMLL